MNTFAYRHEEQTQLELVNGHFELGALQHIIIDGHPIAYCLGNALLDNSCCGSFGCAYALVLGEEIGKADGNTLSLREIGADEPLAERIRQEMFAREAINTVNFYLPPSPPAALPQGESGSA